MITDQELVAQLVAMQEIYKNSLPKPKKTVFATRLYNLTVRNRDGIQINSAKGISFASARALAKKARANGYRCDIVEVTTIANEMVSFKPTQRELEFGKQTFAAADNLPRNIAIAETSAPTPFSIIPSNKITEVKVIDKATATPSTPVNTPLRQKMANAKATEKAQAINSRKVSQRNQNQREQITYRIYYNGKGRWPEARLVLATTDKMALGLWLTSEMPKYGVRNLVFYFGDNQIFSTSKKGN